MAYAAVFTVIRIAAAPTRPKKVATGACLNLE
jgi:hypothetical protein